MRLSDTTQNVSKHSTIEDQRGGENNMQNVVDVPRRRGAARFNHRSSFIADVPNVQIRTWERRVIQDANRMSWSDYATFKHNKEQELIYEYEELIRRSRSPSRSSTPESEPEWLDLARRKKNVSIDWNRFETPENKVDSLEAKNEAFRITLRHIVNDLRSRNVILDTGSTLPRSTKNRSYLPKLRKIVEIYTSNSSIPDDDETKIFNSEEEEDRGTDTLSTISESNVSTSDNDEAPNRDGLTRFADQR